MYKGQALPPEVAIDAATGLPPTDAYDFAFFRIRFLTMGAVVGSMIAYLAAQLCDVSLFHFWKRLTKGKHLWLRNNGSTMVSQLVDSTAVILITWYIGGLAAILTDDRQLVPQLLLLIVTAYVFKFTVALLDTLPFYFLTARLGRFLEVDPNEEQRTGTPGVTG